MINQRQTWCIAIALAFLAAPALGAPPKARKNDEQRENAAVKEARKEVNAAQDRQRAAAKAVRDAEQARQTVEEHHRDLQEAARVVDRAEQTLAKKSAADARDPNNRKGKR